MQGVLKRARNYDLCSRALESVGNVEGHERLILNDEHSASRERSHWSVPQEVGSAVETLGDTGKFQ
jgi:hypothetical protein